MMRTREDGDCVTVLKMDVDHRLIIQSQGERGRNKMVKSLSLSLSLFLSLRSFLSVPFSEPMAVIVALSGEYFYLK